LVKSIPTQIEKFFEMQKYECDSDLFTEEKLNKALKAAMVAKLAPRRASMSLFPG